MTPIQGVRVPGGRAPRYYSKFGLRVQHASVFVIKLVMIGTFVPVAEREQRLHAAISPQKRVGSEAA
jgi:hypothetical protein